MTGKRHLRERREQAAVGSIVVGDEQAVGEAALDDVEERGQPPRIVEIGHRVAHLIPRQRQGRAAEAIVGPRRDRSAAARRRSSGRSCGRDRQTHVRHGRKRGDDQRQRRRHGLPVPVGGPPRVHRHRVLADRNDEAERRAQLHADRANGVEERLVLTRCPAAAIQLADSLTSCSFAMRALAMFVIASATAMRPDAGASTSASGVRSPIAMASPV